MIDEAANEIRAAVIKAMGRYRALDPQTTEAKDDLATAQLLDGAMMVAHVLDLMDGKLTPRQMKEALVRVANDFGFSLVFPENA